MYEVQSAGVANFENNRYNQVLMRPHASMAQPDQKRWLIGHDL
jgi:hypothetical protein